MNNHQRIPFDDIVLTAPVTVPYQKYSDHDATWFIGKALRMLLESGNIKKRDIDGLAVSSFTLAPDTISSLTEHFDLTCKWLESLPYGGASAVTAAKRAARAVQFGDANIVACIGADTSRKGGFKELAENFSRFSAQAVYPYGGSGPNSIFAMITNLYKEKFGFQAEDFGRICIAQRNNALANSNSLFKKNLSMEEYLNARIIAEPLRLFDCVMPCAGAEGFLVMHKNTALRLGLSYVYLLAAEEIFNGNSKEEIQLEGAWSLIKDDLYRSSGCGPEDMDFFQSYDDYPVVVVQQLVGLGFCKIENAIDFIRSTDLRTFGGGLPHNTSGGQLSVGQAGFAGGFLGMVEAIRQLTHQSLGHQILNPEHGLVSGFGMINFDRGLCSTAAILKRGEI